MNVLEHLEEMLPSAQSINEGLLMDMIRANEETEYGKRHGFSSIKSVSDYKRQVPLTDYESYREYVSRMTKGEKNVLTVYPIDMYAVTSGSVGTPKRIPVSDWALTSNVAYYYDLPRETYERYLLEKTGETYDERRQICLAMATEGHVEDGTLLTTFSGGVYFAVQDELLPKLCCAPEAMYGVGIEDYLYLKAFCALAGRDANVLVAPFMAAVSDFFYTIEANWESLCDDLEKARLDRSRKIPKEVVESIEGALPPLPERAEELREIFRQGFDEPIVKKIWPPFSYILAIGTGGFSAYTEKVRRYVGDVPMYISAYAASEGTFATSAAFDRPDNVMIPDAAYFEFIHEDDMGLPAEELMERTLSMGELTPGENYELVVTNLSGFYRYRIGDVLSVTGFEGESPLVRFAYRKNQMLNITGEKTNEKHVQHAVGRMAEEAGLNVVDWTVYADYGATPAHYVIFIETDPPVAPEEKLGVCEILEKGLAYANPSYEDKIKTGRLGRLELQVLQPQTYQLYRDLLVFKGASTNQLKPVHVIDNSHKEKYFFALLEKDL